jgi:hypothetical protein
MTISRDSTDPSPFVIVRGDAATWKAYDHDAPAIGAHDGIRLAEHHLAKLYSIISIIRMAV